RRFAARLNSGVGQADDVVHLCSLVRFSAARRVALLEVDAREIPAYLAHDRCGSRALGRTAPRRGPAEGQSRANRTSIVLLAVGYRCLVRGVSARPPRPRLG